MISLLYFAQQVLTHKNLLIYFDKLSILVLLLFILASAIVYFIYQVIYPKIIFLDYFGIKIIRRNKIILNLKWSEVKKINLYGEHYFLRLKVEGNNPLNFWFFKFSSLNEFNLFLKKIQDYTHLSYFSLAPIIKKKYKWFLPVFTSVFLIIFVYIQLFRNKLMGPDEIIIFLLFPSGFFICAMLGVWLSEYYDSEKRNRINQFLSGKINPLTFLSFYIFIFTSTLIFLVLIFKYSKGPYTKNLYLLDYFYSSAAIVLISSVFIYIATKLTKSEKYFKEQVVLIHKAEFFCGTSVIVFLGYLYFSLFLSELNITLDTGEVHSSITTIELTSEFYFHDKTLKCYRLHDWISNRDTSFRYCTYYDKFKPSDEVEVFYKNGYFKKRWVKSIRPAWANNFDNYVNHVGKIEEIDFSDINYFIMFNKFFDFKNLIQKFKINCDKGEAHFCRMVGYIIEILHAPQNAISFYQQGCRLNDFLSCLNYLKLIYKWNTHRSVNIFLIESFLESFCENTSDDISISNCQKYREWDASK